VTDIKFDTSSYAKYLPIFKQKLGPNKPLRLETNLKDFKIKLGQFDVDIEAEFTLCMGYYLDTTGSPELLYDEFKMLGEFNIDMKKNVMKPNIKKFQLKLDGNTQRTAPTRNKLKMTTNEYQEFLSAFGMSAN
jgi:hypothetical protein